MKKLILSLGCMTVAGLLVCSCSKDDSDAGDTPGDTGPGPGDVGPGDVTPDAGVDLTPQPDAGSDLTPKPDTGGADVAPQPDLGGDQDVTVQPDLPVDAAELPPNGEIVWVPIPAGSFEMGCSPGDEECFDVERPSHTVNISAFEMSATEITQAQFEEVIGENPSTVSICPDCPVDSVWWSEARQLCEAMGGRLPTEAEWEYAARAGSTTRFFCGDDSSCLDAVAWYVDNSDNVTHQVGQKEPNAFGLHDTLGNVWEWLEDCWHDDYTDAPDDGRAWEDTEGGDCSYRILRGGCWGLGPRGLRVSNRDADYPDSYLIAPPGFRCVRDVAER